MLVKKDFIGIWASFYYRLECVYRTCRISLLKTLHPVNPLDLDLSALPILRSVSFCEQMLFSGFVFLSAGLSLSYSYE